MFLARSAAIMNMILGGLEQTYLYKSTPNGCKCKKSFLVDMEPLFYYVDPGFASAQLCHWCYLTEDSPEVIAGINFVGDRCCTCKQESIDKVCEAVENILCGRAMDTACALRWVHVSNLRKQYLLATICGNILPTALKDMHTYGVYRCAPTGIRKMIKAVGLDFHATSKLRLLKICKELCTHDGGCEMAVIDIGESLRDKFLYDALGHNKARCTMLDFFTPATSSVCSGQSKFADRICMWGPSCPHWAVLESLGANFEDTA